MSEPLDPAAPAAPQVAAPATLRPAPPAEPSVADGVERRLDPAYVPLERLRGAIALAAAAAVLVPSTAVLFLVGDLPLWAAALIAPGVACVLALVAFFGLWWPAVSAARIAYRVLPEMIEIRRGVLWRSVANVPRPRVQHTDVSQGPLERRFGLATLVIYTAGTEYAEVDLPGLDRASALRIRDHLLGGGDDAV
jgi:membrane protein YdbS with pleckstrin-like domain